MLKFIKKTLFWISIVFLIACAVVTVLPLPQDENAVLLLEFLGSFHPMILHLPIGLWFGMLLLLFADGLSRKRSLRRMLLVGAGVTLFTAFLAFASGANLYLAGAYERASLLPHMLGALAFLCGLLLFCVQVERGAHGFLLWCSALASMGILGFAGHVGGVITHGDPMEKAPWVVQARLAEEGARSQKLRQANAEDPLLFDHVVMPILEGKCMNCHGSSRAKGKLRMDSYAALLKGGSQGPSLIPGNEQGSLMLARVHLPMADKEHMPPQDKEQLTPEELAFLEWWVASAADPSLKVREASLPAELSPLVESYAGDSPEAIRQREQRRQKEELLEQYAKVSASFPGIVTQAVQGEARFELNAASMYDLDEAALRKRLKPLVPHLLRIDWNNRVLSPEWMELFMRCTQLETLNLIQAEVAEEALITLIGQNPKLRKVNLFGVALSDAIVPVLQPRLAGGDLAWVNLSETQLSPEGLQALEQAIPQITLRF